MLLCKLRDKKESRTPSVQIPEVLSLFKMRASMSSRQVSRSWVLLRYVTVGLTPCAVQTCTTFTLCYRLHEVNLLKRHGSLVQTQLIYCFTKLQVYYSFFFYKISYYSDTWQCPTCFSNLSISDLLPVTPICTQSSKSSSCLQGQVLPNTDAINKASFLISDNWLITQAVNITDIYASHTKYTDGPRVYNFTVLKQGFSLPEMGRINMIPPSPCPILHQGRRFGNMFV